MMLWSRETIVSAFGFLVAMLAMAGEFALLDNSFLFLAQIMVSVGAVVILSLIVITTINLKDENLPDEPRKLGWMLFSSLMVTPFALLMYRALIHLQQKLDTPKEGYGTLKSMGSELFSNWVLPFEIVSVLLLAAMLAAIVIARRETKQ